MRIGQHFQQELVHEDPNRPTPAENAALSLLALLFLFQVPSARLGSHLLCGAPQCLAVRPQLPGNLLIHFLHNLLLVTHKLASYARIVEERASTRNESPLMALRHKASRFSVICACSPTFSLSFGHK